MMKGIVFKMIDCHIHVWFNYLIILCSDSLLMEILSDKVAESQQLMRKYADEHYLESKMFTKTEAEELSKSCVSQRDIQVCHMYHFI